MIEAIYNTAYEPEKLILIQEHNDRIIYKYKTRIVYNQGSRKFDNPSFIDVVTLDTA